MSDQVLNVCQLLNLPGVSAGLTVIAHTSLLSSFLSTAYSPAGTIVPFILWGSRWLGPHLWEDIFLSVSVQSQLLELTYRQESPQLSQTFHLRGWNAEEQNSITELVCGSNNPHLTMVNETFVTPRFLMRMLCTHHFFQVFTQTVKAFTDFKRS